VHLGSPRRLDAVARLRRDVTVKRCHGAYRARPTTFRSATMICC
jgi:hypothetical protein